MFSIIIPMGLALVHGSKLPQNLKPLWLTLIFSLVCDVVSYFLAKNSINTHWVGNIYLVIQFSLIIWLFREQFQNKRFNDVILILFVVFYVLNLVFFQGPWVFNSVSNVVACLILISLCLYFFHRLLNDLPIVHIHRLPMLWISFAVLTYYGGNFFLFLVKNYLSYGEAGTHKLMWILHNLLNIIKNVLFAIGLWQSYRNVRSSTLLSSAL
jgi:hypothetical protein